MVPSLNWTMYQPCLKVTKEPDICKENSVAGGDGLLAAISLVQILEGQVYPQDRGCELLLLWEQLDRSFHIT